MGKLARVLLILICVLAVVFPRIAVKVRNMVGTQQDKLKGLAEDVKDTKAQLSEMEEELGAKLRELDDKTNELKKKQADLKLVTGQFNQTREELKKKEAALNDCILAKEKVAGNINRLKEERTVLAEKLSVLSELLKEVETSRGSSFVNRGGGRAKRHYSARQDR